MKKLIAYLKNPQTQQNIKRYVRGSFKLLLFLLTKLFYYLRYAVKHLAIFLYQFIKWIAINTFLVAKAMLRQFLRIIGMILFDGFKAGYDQIKNHRHSLQDNLGRILASAILLWSILFFGYHVSANTITTIISSFGNPTLTASQQKATEKHIRNLKNTNAWKHNHPTKIVLPNGDYMPSSVSYTYVKPLANSPLTKHQIKSPAQYQNGKLKVVNKLFTHPANSDEKFINSLVVAAQTAALSYGVNPSVVIAQAYVESQYGTSELAVKYKNYFGIKYNGVGQKINLPTKEQTSDGTVYVVNADFQVYSSLNESMAANTSLIRYGISSQPNRYSGAWVENTNSYEDATKALTGTYATAVDYNTILNKFIQTYGLYVLDSHAIHNPDLVKAK